MPEIKHTPGPWRLATSNSWRRIENYRSQPVCVPTSQRDGHPDLIVSDEDGRLLAAAPTLLAFVERMRSYMDQAGIDSKPESMNPMEKLASDIDLTLAELAQPLNPA